MHVVHHSLDFKLGEQFPNARRLKGWEGGISYMAERDNKPFIILDESTLADLLTDEDAEGLSFVKVIEFSDEAERDAYIRDELRFGVNFG